MPADQRAPASATPETDPLDELPCGFLAFGDDGIVTRVNAPFARELGYDPAELTGRHVETVLGPGGRLFYQTHVFPLLKMQGRAEELFMLFRPRQGEDVGVLLNAHRVERGGTTLNECALFIVRERRKFEDALLRARQAADAARAEVEQRNRELADANERLIAQAHELELQQEQLHQQATELEIQQDQLQETNEVLIRRGEELERQRAAALAANKAKSDFLAMMSHELRTPLNAIGGYAELLEMEVSGPIGDEQRRSLGRIRTSQRHLLGLINSVLGYAKVESNSISYEIERLAVAEVLATCETLTALQARARRLELVVEACDPSIAAMADREKLRQIVLNLLTNAIKFTEPGGRIAASCRASGEEVLVEVRDTGHGIPPDQLEHVFEPFVQIESGLARSNEGVGLGLAISRDLARGMGGQLSATSEVGVGSVFTLTLPRAR